MKDDEIYGTGNVTTALYWEYDCRLGRRWNIDPKSNPSISSYACFADNPLLYKDVPGDTVVISLYMHRNKEGELMYRIKFENIISQEINDGVFMIVAHGGTEHITNQTGGAGSGPPNKARNDWPYQITSPKEFYDMLYATSGQFKTAIDEGMPITMLLASCNNSTGPEEFGISKEDNNYFIPFAQQFSNFKKDFTIIGARGTVKVGKVDKSMIGKGAIGRAGYWGILGVEGEEENGQWVIYRGGKELFHVSGEPFMGKKPQRRNQASSGEGELIGGRQPSSSQ